MATLLTANAGVDSNLKDELDIASPGRIPDALRAVKLGSALRSYTTRLYRKVPAAGTQLATLQTVVLPDDAKAALIHRAFARTGTAGTGELTVVAYGVTPATGQIAVAPNGDLVVLAADALLDLDVVYLPVKYDVYSIDLPVASNVATLPTALTASPLGVCQLLGVSALTGTVSGDKIVLIPGSGSPATGQARLNIAKTTVTFASADAVTNCRLKLGIVPLTDMDADLEAAPFNRNLFGADGSLK